MKQTAKTMVIALLLASLQCPTHAQLHAPYAEWLLPGVSYQFSKKTRLLAQAGYNHYLHAGLFYPEAFITVHKNIVLNPAYIYLVQKNEGLPTVKELYFMNAVLLQAATTHFFIEDRNMLWDRFTSGLPARHYYRNRLKVGWEFKNGTVTTKLYTYDEVFYLFNNGLIARNRPALGANIDLSKHLNTEITYIRQWDRYAGRLNLFFIQAIWKW